MQRVMSLAWSLAALGPAIAQSNWTETGAMLAPTTQHPATLLPNGKVLVVGSLSCDPGCFSGFTAQLYDPGSSAWTMANAPHVQRFNHVAELIPSGKALIAGGYVSPGLLTGSAELYDPATGAWTSTGSMATPRQFHTSALLPSGKVLVAGGLGMDGQGSFLTLSSAELYDPATGLWTPAGNMSVPRWSHSMTALADGRVLLVGGFANNSPSAPPLQSAEIYNPATGTWTMAATPGFARANHHAVSLPQGQVLVTGGNDATNCLGSAEIYDPVSDRWTATASMSGPRRFHSLTLLPSGRVLAAAGGDCTTTVLSSSEIYDPVAATWSAGASLIQARREHSATLLQSGKVLVAGGDGAASQINVGFASSELLGTNLQQGGIASVSAASFLDNAAIAPESLAAAFGSNLAAGMSVSVRDVAGTTRPATVLSGTSGQINYQVPSGTATGLATVTVNQGGNAIASGNVLIEPVAPGLFSADGSGRGLAAALVETVKADGTQTYAPVTMPIDLSSPTDQVFLLLFGTGIRFRSSPSAVSALIGLATVEATFAGPSPQFPGVDQVNLLLPPSLAGSGTVAVSLSVDGLVANTVSLTIR